MWSLYMIMWDVIMEWMIMNTLRIMNDAITYVMLMDYAYMSACIWSACGNVWTCVKEGSVKKCDEDVWSDNEVI